jgi:hypothetical protein
MYAAVVNIVLQVVEFPTRLGAALDGSNTISKEWMDGMSKSFCVMSIAASNPCRLPLAIIHRTSWMMQITPNVVDSLEAERLLG